MCDDKMVEVTVSLFNPNTFVGVGGEGAKKPEGGRKGGWRIKAHAARPRGLGLKSKTCRVLGEGPQLHAMGVVWTSKPFRAYR